MFKRFLSLTLFLPMLLVYDGWGQILTFEVNGLTGATVTLAHSTKDANLANSTLSRGDGLTAVSANNTFTSSGYANDFTSNDYLEFTVTPNTFYKFSVTSISFFASRSNTGPPTAVLRSSEDSYASDIDAPKTVLTTASTITFNVNISDKSNPVTFRLYGYGTTNSGGTFRISNTTGADISVSGSTASTEPTTNAQSVSFPSVSNSGMTINWINGDGAGRAVFVKEATVGTITPPVDGTTYTASADWSVPGTELGTSGYLCVYSGADNSVTLTNLSEGTAYYVYVYEYNGSGTSINYKTTDPATGNQATTSPGTPTITVSAASLSSFGTVVAGNTSTENSFTVSGADMDGAVSVAPPSGFQVSLTTGGPYSTDPLEVSSDRNFGPVDVFVIFQPGTAGNYSGDLTVSGGTATSKTVAVTGKALSLEPTTQATAATVASSSDVTLSLNWTKGNGDNRIVLMKQGSAVNASPVDGTSYTANLAFGTGSEIGTGNRVVYAGSTAQPITVTGLTAGSSYHIAVFEFNGSGGTENYLTTDPARANGATLTISAGTVSPTAFCVDASNGATGTIAYTVTGVYGASNTFTAYLSDAAGSFASETSIGTISNTTGGGTINISVPAGTIAGSGYKIRIKSSDPAVITSTESSTLTVVFGISNVTTPSASVGNQKSILSWTNPTNCFDEIMIVAKAGAAAASPSGDGSAYTANLVFGSGTPFDGGFVVYKGSASPQTVTGLTNGTAYNYTFFTRRGSSWSNGTTVNATPLNQLEPGDIAIILLQASTTDKYAFVTLVDINGGTQIHFTDNAFDGSALKTNEGTVTWTAPEGGISKGTVVTITPYSQPLIGTITGSGMSLATGGDPIIAYTGSNNYIFALSNTPWRVSGTVTNNDSYLPTGLTDGYSAVATSTVNNIYFTSESNQGSRISFLSSICRSAIWTTNANAFASLPAWTFTFSNTATTPSVPTGSSVSVSTGGTTGISNITFTTVTASGTLTVDRFNNAPSSHNLSGNVSGYRFIITPDNSLVFTQGDGYTLRFDIANLPANFGISELSEGDNTTIRLYKRSTPGSGDPTGPIAMTYHRNGTDGNQSDDYLTSALITDGFSEFFFQSNSEPLPVELTSFTARAQGTSVTLNWETKTEIDNNGFEVERNANGAWQKIGFVEGHGTANSPKYYSFSDANPLGNKIQYRLKQIDNDGDFEYSDVVEVELAPVSYTLYQNYPNPFNPSTVIRYALPVAGMVSIDVFNALGEKVATLLNGEVEAGYNQVSFDATNLPSGLYFYRIQSGDFTSIKKMLLMK